MAQGLSPVAVFKSDYVYTSTTTSAALRWPLADEFSILLNVTTVSGSTPLMDVVFQTSIDKGTTYANIPIRSAQITAAGVHWFTLRRGLGWGEAAFNQAGVADTGGALAKNCVFDHEYMKLKATVAGTTPSYTFSLVVFCNPRGSNGAV